MKTATLKGYLGIGVTALSFLGGSQLARAGFSLGDTATFGDAATYAVLFEGGGHNNLDLSGPDTFFGNLGVGAPSGSTPGAQLSGQLTLYGSVNLNFAGSPGANYQNSATFNGPGSFSEHQNVTQVQTDLNNLNSFSSTWASVTGPDPNVNINNPSFGGTIVLTGGLNSDNVLFNFTGGSALSGGPTLTVSANGATERGTFLDPNGPMSIDNTVLVGHFFGGDSHNDQVVSGATIVPEASTMIAGLLLLFPFAVSTLRIVRKTRTP